MPDVLFWVQSDMLSFLPIDVSILIGESLGWREPCDSSGSVCDTAWFMWELRIPCGMVLYGTIS